MSITIDFLIRNREKARALRNNGTVRRVENLFAVRLGLSVTQRSQGEWVTVHGAPENVTKAKKYILALCTPDFATEFRSVGNFAGLLFGENSRLRDDLEREYATVIQPSAAGHIQLQGSEFDVCLTVSRLSTLMDTMDNGNRPVESTPAQSSHPAELQSSSQLDSQLRDAIRQVGSDPSNIENLSDSIKRALLEGLKGNVERRKSDSEIGETPVIVPGSLRGVDSHREQRISFFVQLGYRREKVEAVFESLGPAATEDDILSRLVKVSGGTHSAEQRGRLNSSRPRGFSGEPMISYPMLVRDPSILRPIVIDGSNVAMRHGNGQVFSCRGISLAVQWFLQRGHLEITVFVPQWRKEPSKPESVITDQEILYQLEREGRLVFTPSRKIRNKRIVCYDDRFILHLASITNGVIVSNDNFRDLLDENPKWKETVEQRLLMFAFVSDLFMVPDDPLGRHGPHLDQLLQLDARTAQMKGVSPEKLPARICPYLDRCTFGNKCKYYHPEKEGRDSNTSSKSPSRSVTPPAPERRHVASRNSSAEELFPPDRPPKEFGRSGDQIDVHELKQQMEKIVITGGQPSPQKHELKPVVEPHPYPAYYPAEPRTHEQSRSYIHHPKPQYLQIPPSEPYLGMQTSPGMHRSPQIDPSMSTPLEGTRNPYSMTYPIANLSSGPLRAENFSHSQSYPLLSEPEQRPVLVPRGDQSSYHQRVPTSRHEMVRRESVDSRFAHHQPLLHSSSSSSSLQPPHHVPERTSMGHPVTLQRDVSPQQHGFVSRDIPQRFVYSQQHQPVQYQDYRPSASSHTAPVQSYYRHSYTYETPQPQRQMYPQVSSGYEQRTGLVVGQSGYSPSIYTYPHTRLHPSPHEELFGRERDGPSQPQREHKSDLFAEAAVVLPHCEDRIRAIMKQYPRVKDLDILVRLVQQSWSDR